MLNKKARFFFWKSKKYQRMADILDIAKEQAQRHAQPQINVEKLRDLCSKKNVWDHFRIEKEDFFNLSYAKQWQLTSRFYFDNVNNSADNQHQLIDESIGNIIKNSDGINFTKVYQNGNNRTEMSISAEKKKDEKKRKLLPCGKKMVFFLTNVAILTLKKQICPKIRFFIWIKGI